MDMEAVNRIRHNGRFILLSFQFEMLPVLLMNSQ